ARVKVGNRQAPQSQKPHPQRWGFCVYAAVIGRDDVPVTIQPPQFDNTTPESARVNSLSIVRAMLTYSFRKRWH
ncbi:hypothetical protein, partial [Paraburkholderia atlantica]|uniref:hypothetical protein n=1 Tax=Paraburkholderia atlantica TaxID=2654982 RepID=UPI001C8488C6